MTSSEPEQPGSARPVFRVVLRGLGVFLGGVMILAVGLLGALQFDGIGTRVATAVGERVAPEGLDFSVGRVSGSWLTSLRMVDVALTGPEGDEVVRVDTLSARYSVVDLLSRRLRLSEVEVVGSWASLVRRVDGTIGLKGASPSDLPPSDGSVSSPWTVTLGALRVNDGAGRLTTIPDPAAEASATTLTWSDLYVAVRDLRTGSDAALITDSAMVRLAVPTLPPEMDVGPVDVRLLGRLADGRLTLDTLEMTATGGRVDAAGAVPLPGAESAVGSGGEANSTRAPLDLDLRLVATTLPLAPLHAFLGNSSAPDARLSADLRVTGTTELPRATIEATTSDGGRISGSLAFDPGGEGRARYQADLTLASLDPMTFTGDSAIAGDVGGSVNVDLEGASASELSGSATLQLDPLRVGGIPLRRVSLGSDWTDGEASLALDVAGQSLDAELSGRARLLDAIPTYDVDGSFSADLPPDSATSPKAGTPVHVAGSVSLAGEGFTPDSATVDAGVDLDTLMLGSATLGSARLTARLDSGRIAARLDAGDTSEGTLSADGVIVLGSPTTFRVRDAVARDLDIAAILGDTVASRLDGRLEGAGTLGAPGKTRVVVDATLRDALYGTLRVDTTAFAATLEEGRLTGSGRLRATAGRVDFEFSGHPLDDVPVIDDVRVEYADVELGALAGDTASALSTRLTGALTGSVAGSTPETLEGEFDVRLDSSRVARQMLVGSQAEITISGGRVELRADVGFPGAGGFDIAAAVRPFDTLPTARVSELRFRALDPGAFARTDSIPASAWLNGSASGEIEGFDPATMSGTASIELDASRVRSEPVPGGRIALSVNDGRADADARIDLGSGEFRADGSFGFGAEVPAWALTARLAASRLDRLLGADSPTSRGHVDATLEVEGRGITLASMEAEVRAFADSAAVGGLRVDTLRLIGRVSEGSATVDTLTVRSNALTVSGQGSVSLDETAARAPDLRVTGEVRSLQPLEAVVGLSPLRLGTGTFDLEVSGPPNSSILTASANASALLLGTTELEDLQASVQATLEDGVKVGSAEVGLSLDRLTAAGIDVRLSETSGSWDGEQLTVEASATVDDRRDLALALRADPRAEARRLELDRFDIRVDGDQWSLTGTPNVSWREGIEVDSLVLRAGDTQAVRLNGRLDTGGSSDLVAAVEELRIGGIADLFGMDRLEGTVSGELNLEGPSSSPRARLEMSADLSDHRNRQSRVRGTLTYDTLRLGVDVTVEAEGGGRMVALGGLPLDMALTRGAESAPRGLASAATGPTDLEIRADSFDVAWIEPFLNPMAARGLTGRLQADVQVGGTQAAPVLTGQATMRDARLTAPALGVTWEQTGVRLSLRDDMVRVDSALVRTGDGSMSVSGSMQLSELSLGAFDLEAELDEFKAMNNEAYRVRMSGSAALRGTTAEPRLEGDLDLVETDVYLDDAVSSGASVRPVELTEEEIRRVEDYLGISVTKAERNPNPLFERMELDLSVSASRDTWVRQRANPELEIQLSGDVRVTKAPTDSLRLDGEIDAVASRSYVEQFGRRFSIRQGRIELRGTLPETRVDVMAVYDVPSRGNPGASEATITLEVDGTVNDLSLTLGSEPEMENADIVSYLATGRPASSGLSVGDDGGGGGGLGAIGADYALGQVTGLVEGLAADGIGLDVVEIEADGLRGATLVAGRFVSPRVYVGFKQPIGREAGNASSSTEADRTEVEIEYEALEWLLMNMEASNSTISFFFRFRYAY